MHHHHDMREEDGLRDKILIRRLPNKVETDQLTPMPCVMGVKMTEVLLHKTTQADACRNV